MELFESKAVCKTCDKLISHGGKEWHDWCHKGMLKHLATHGMVNSEFKQKPNAKEKDEKTKM